MVALVWTPGLAAILTCRILARPLSRLGLGRWNGRFVLIAHLIPIAYCLLASVGTVIVLFVLRQDTTGMVAGVGAAAGMEIGWRGFLVLELWMPSVFFPVTTAATHQGGGR